MSSYGGLLNMIGLQGWYIQYKSCFKTIINDMKNIHGTLIS